jgi:predicted ATPase/DNA-binding winged helix-turn-helix (wHTH) protein
MHPEPSAPVGHAVSFGPFELFIGQRLLLKEGVPVEIGGRSLDALIALLTRANEVVCKKDLMALVWPDVTVEESSLRFHIAALRKVLGDGVRGARYITTLSGRGYCFVAPISGASPPESGRRDTAMTTPRAHALPLRLARMVGRGECLVSLASQLTGERFVTVVGPGGVGKTTLAIAVANDLSDAFADGVVFVDLSALSDPNLAATSLALMLGLSVQTDDPTPSLVAYLRSKSILLIFDNCEHLVDACATLASRIFGASPGVHILATSREALRVEGEHVYKLNPLACPPEDAKLVAADLLAFPAAQLFVERARAGGAQITPSDEDAATVAAICRKLDGVALAIELAAGRVGAYGLQHTAALLDERLALVWRGQRTAPGRQQTLRATLDWSYGLLSETERRVLRRLAVFAGDFTLEAARTVLAKGDMDEERVLAAIDSLVSKSMLLPIPVAAAMRYRLLETTRAYALEVITDAELADASARHARYYRLKLEETGPPRRRDQASAAALSSHFADVANVRAALEWCFGVNGDPDLGVSLASVATPAFVATSLFSECRRWSERALLAFEAEKHEAREQMRLQATAGMSMMFLRGHSELALAALNQSLAIAEQCNDAVTQLQLIASLLMYYERIGQFKVSLAYARRAVEISATIADPNVRALAHSLLGFSLTRAGELVFARMELEAALRLPDSPARTTMYLGFEGHVLAGVFLGPTLWLQGYPAQAIASTRRSLAHAAATNHSVTLSIATMCALSVFFWVGDLEAAENQLEAFVARAQALSLGPYVAVGRGFKGQLAVCRGNAQSGVDALRSALADLHAVRYELMTTAFSISLAQGLAMMDRFEEGLTHLDDAIANAEASGDGFYLPELLRVKGAVLRAMTPSSEDAAACLAVALDSSRQSGALGWELRISIDLASLWLSTGQPQRARELLRPVLARFDEGAKTVDLRAAEQLLAALS